MFDTIKSELDAYHRKETEAELRSERLEAAASFLMEEGHDCYPFTPSHVNEAMMELSSGQLAVLSACLAEAEKKNRKDDHANHLALVSLLIPIKEYWREIAIKEAEEYID